MGRENTTSDDWNYTLPNLLEYLDGLLEGGGQPHSNPILPNPNKDAEAPATTLWGALTSSSTPPTTTTTTPAPINKPMFVMNFTLRTTVDTLLQTRVNLSKALDPLTSPAAAGGSVLGLDVDPSDVGLGLGVATLSSASSTSSASSSSSSSPAASSSASTPDLLLAGNDSLVTLDDSFWLAGGNDSANQSHFFGNETSDGLIVDTVGMVITSVILGIMILTTVIGNVFVIAAILLERNLQQVANFLIVSLAVADLMVACLVMPLGAVYASLEFHSWPSSLAFILGLHPWPSSLAFILGLHPWPSSLAYHPRPSILGPPSSPSILALHPRPPSSPSILALQLVVCTSP
ncbi:5-hydroxytryptamine receptor 1-like [Penaeus monodon]|uniref:5-hydroxytryptamine receptor 1-like n=1 Tax=Penaeus monodon TaxID=6687 RepID=UPI0018A7BBE4|nr:5-hydroxytryptamine receptor 1-like [Penaeus monodon]